ncbi:MAG TPA: M1 family metallopeptidase [Polyangiales bacterium]|nr:M1 family metallopeptidase [Polyangiales bacterium]
MSRILERVHFPLLAFCAALIACGGSKTAVEPTPMPVRAPEGKLPDGVRPTAYRLNLQIIPDGDSFHGTADIDVELDAPSSIIWMHGQDLDVTSIHARHGSARVQADWEQQTSDGVVRVVFTDTLPQGRSTLEIEYSAKFDTPLRGLYRVESGDDSYAFTQFESISARLAFPCFDEPRFKTPFEVTLTVPDDQIAAANTPIERATRLPNGLQRVSFLPTPPLPTYLVAWAVGPLDVVIGPTIAPTKERSFPIPLRGLAAKGKGEQLRFALQRTGKFIEALEDYFGIPYPYRKLDLVAVPDFAAGAMENAGLITFREWLLLIDEAHATESQYRAFAYVMAHELSHQWFGNLVTMPWWDDIWLNEAFATWMGNKVVQALHPEYRSDLAALGSGQRAMDLDSLTSARSIRQPIESNHDIKNAFDAITYEKGGSMLSMFERWMGVDVFRDGIRLYLRRHENSTATSDDLLAALDEASDLEVTAPFLSFLTRPGVPLMTVAGDEGCEGGFRNLRLSQQRYLPIGSRGSPKQTWKIPFCVQFDLGVSCGLLTEAEASVQVPGCPSWWMPNADGAGYFRFAMSPDEWTHLRTEGFAKLSDGGQMAVADSLAAAFDRGALGAEDLLPWFPIFVRSPLRQIATAPMESLRFMIVQGAPPDLRGEVTKYASRLYRSRYERLGWRTRNGESSDTKLLREAVIRFMVMDVRDGGARARAAKLGRTYVGYRTQAKPSVVDAQLADLVLAAAVQEGGEALFDHLLHLLASSTDATTRNRIISALGHAEAPSLSERALDLALDPGLRVNEIPRLLGTQFGNPRNRERAWEWLTEHFDALAARFGSTQVGGTPWYASSFCSETAADDVARFFEPRVSELDGGPRNLAGAVEAISLCAEKTRVQQPGVERAFAGK